MTTTTRCGATSRPATRERAGPGRPRALRRQRGVEVARRPRLRRAAPASTASPPSPARAEPRRVPRHRWLAALPAQPGHPQRLGAPAHRDARQGLAAGHRRGGPAPGLDYDIDYLQGRILLSEPLSSNGGDNLLVRSGGLSGDEAWLVARYEYAPGFDEIDTLATGGRPMSGSTTTSARPDWNRNDDGDGQQPRTRHLTLRKSAETWLKVQAGAARGWCRTRCVG